MTAVLLLNWNGAELTIACLESLEKASGEFFTVIADNGSTDDSLQKIGDYLASSKLDAELLPLGENLGFAAGNNRAVSHALKRSPDHLLLLNNDTEVDAHFLERLEAFGKANPLYAVLSPRIMYFAEKDRIWFCGGKLVPGSRKPLFKNCNESVLDGKEFLDIDFASGCALYCPARLAGKDGRLLTERFFFGEEDYEFALRMRSQGVRMACVTDSIVWHKVGSSAKKFSKGKELGRHYMYYLGKFICNRLYYNRIVFTLLCLANWPTCFRYFKADCGSARKAFCITSRLMREARTKKGIDASDFRCLVTDNNYFD